MCKSNILINLVEKLFCVESHISLNYDSNGSKITLDSDEVTMTTELYSILENGEEELVPAIFKFEIDIYQNTDYNDKVYTVYPQVLYNEVKLAKPVVFPKLGKKFKAGLVSPDLIILLNELPLKGTKFVQMSQEDFQRIDTHKYKTQLFDIFENYVNNALEEIYEQHRLNYEGGF